MSGMRVTGLRTALTTVPLVLGLLGTAAGPAAAVDSHEPRPGKPSPAAERVSTRAPSSATGARS